MPPSASSAVAVVSASASCACRLILRTQRPNRIIPITAMGTMASIIRVSRHDITKMMIRPPTSVIVCDTRLSRVEVTASWIVITSVPSREISSPTRVPAKKRSGMDCRWP